jgi:hypothetical protein
VDDVLAADDEQQQLLIVTIDETQPALTASQPQPPAEPALSVPPPATVKNLAAPFVDMKPIPPAPPPSCNTLLVAQSTPSLRRASMRFKSRRRANKVAIVQDDLLEAEASLVSPV